jgi:hypothetical protein
MAYYRLYFFRSGDRNIREVREFEAPHDFAAVYEAARWRSSEAMELWCGARKVTRWIAAGGQPATPAPRASQCGTL